MRVFAPAACAASPTGRGAPWDADQAGGICAFLAPQHAPRRPPEQVPLAFGAMSRGTRGFEGALASLRCFCFWSGHPLGKDGGGLGYPCAPRVLVARRPKCANLGRLAAFSGRSLAVLEPPSSQRAPEGKAREGRYSEDECPSASWYQCRGAGLGGYPFFVYWCMNVVFLE